MRSVRMHVARGATMLTGDKQPLELGVIVSVFKRQRHAAAWSQIVKWNRGP